MTMNIPEGKATGLLPRTTRPGELCSMFSTYLGAKNIDVIPPSERAKYATGDTLKHEAFSGKFRLDQDGIGSCGCESTANAIMAVEAFGNQEDAVLLNPWPSYNRIRNGQDQGTTLDENLAYARKFGAVPDSAWPRYERNEDGSIVYRQGKGVIIHRWNERVPDDVIELGKSHRIDEFFEISSIDEAITALLLRMPVVFGAKGHAVCMVEYKDDRAPIIENSWGQTWGDNGYGHWCNYSEIGWAYGVFAIATIIEGA